MNYRVLSGAEPFYIDGNGVGCLLSHGFTGTPQSVRFLGEYLAQHAGFSIAAPRLAGHGTTPEDMARTTAEDWIRTLEGAMETLRRHCGKVFVCGLSMGGTLALYLAGMYPEMFSGVVAINAPVSLNSPDFARLAFMAQAPEVVPGIGSDIKQPGIQELVYSVVPVPAIRQIYALTAAARDLLPRITCPALVMQSREDHVVRPDNGPLILECLGAQDKRLVWLENSYHVATLDYDKERIARKVLDFMQVRSGDSRPNSLGGSQ